MTTFPPSTSPRPAATVRSQVARDWLKTLWRASYKGVPFQVEIDDEEGRRRIVEHEFPMSDTPYNEDLGEGVRHYTITGYVASDASDADAASVIAICAQRGPGLLVLPSQGPKLVRCLTFRRNRAKDRHGFEAVDLKFCREGSGSALASVASLANLIFVTAEQTALTVALSFASAITVLDQPAYVVDAAIGGIQDASSSLEAIRTSAPVDATVSSAQRTQLQALFNDADTLPETPAVGTGVYQTAAGQASNSPAVDLAARVVASARALSAGIPPTEAAAQFEQLFQSFQIDIDPPKFVTPGTLLEVKNQAASYAMIRMAALTAYSEAIARMTFADRPAAITVRANVAEYFESELLITSADDLDLAHAIMKLRDSVVTYLSQAIISLAPIIAIDANLSMPSLFWAWRLYQDPTRATELAQRNRVAHPSFMPPAFEALAS